MKKQVICSLFVLLCGSLPLKLMAGQGSASKNHSRYSVDLSEKVIPSVVFIAVEEKFYDDSNADSLYSLYGYLHPFYEFWWPSEYAHGSGFVLSAEGYVVTCAHVVGSATHIRVVMRGSECRMYEGTIVGVDERSDVAVIKIEHETEMKFPFLALGDSNAARVGETVFAVGSPLYAENESTVTRGIISAKERNDIGMHEIEGYIQTDAVIRGGNSGGPLINEKGEVLGINSIGSYTGIAWAVPSNTIRQIPLQLIENGEVAQGFLGVELDLTKDDAFDVYYFARHDGARVIRVIPDSPADLLGIKEGDIIEEVNAYPISSAESLRNQICVLEEGTEVHLIVNRDGVRTQCSTELGSSSLSKLHSVFPTFYFFSEPKLVI